MSVGSSRGRYSVIHFGEIKEEDYLQHFLCVPLERFRKFQDVQLIQVNIIGSMGTGKTNAAFRLAELIIEYYGEDRVQVLRAHRISSVLDHYDDRPVKFVILDDPDYVTLGHVHSKAARYEYNILTRLRHLTREKIGWGRVILCILHHSLRDIVPRFRKALFRIFTSVLQDELNELEAVLGREHVAQLIEVTARKTLFESEYMGWACVQTHLGDVFWVEFSKARLEVPFIDEETHEDLVSCLRRWYEQGLSEKEISTLLSERFGMHRHTANIIAKLVFTDRRKLATFLRELGYRVEGTWLHPNPIVRLIEFGKEVGLVRTDSEGYEFCVFEILNALDTRAMAGDVEATQLLNELRARFNARRLADLSRKIIQYVVNELGGKKVGKSNGISRIKIPYNKIIMNY